MKKGIINGNKVVMIEKYEQAIKETFEYLDQCIAEQQAKHLGHLGLLKDEIIERQMAKRGFTVKTEVYPSQCEVRVYPRADNLPIHIWRQK